MRKITILTTIIISMLLTGCTGLHYSGSENQVTISQNSMKESNSSAENITFITSRPDDTVPVGNWESTDLTLKLDPRMLNDTLYCYEGTYDSETGKQKDISFYRKVRGIDTARITYLEETEEFLAYTVDVEGNLYCLYADEETFSLRKTDIEGTIIYDIPVSETRTENLSTKETAAIERINSYLTGEAAASGEICFANEYGDFFFFDPQGELFTIGTAPWTKDNYNSACCGLVNAGKSGIFTYIIEGREITLHKVNLMDGTLEKPFSISLDVTENSEIYSETTVSIATLELFNAYDMGILISDSDSLWQFEVSIMELKKLLDWSESTLNLKGYQIDTIGMLPDETVYLMLHQSYEEVDFIHITYKPPAELQEKKVVTIGTSVDNLDYEALQLITSDYNRENTKYTIEYILYEDIFDLQTALIQGEGADLFLLDNYIINLNMLADKGVLEDLIPYFQESAVVKLNDLLPSIQRAMNINNKVYCAFPTYYVNGYAMKEGLIENGTWTPEEYISFGESMLGIALTHDIAIYKEMVLKNAIYADMDSYIDFEKKECYFNQQRFIALMEKVQKLETPILKPPKGLEESIAFSNEIYDKIHADELLICNKGISVNESITFKVPKGTYSVKYDFLEIVGYPNENAEPYYELDPQEVLVLNRNSKEKEGAWAFLEYLLSESYQSQLDVPPVRNDCFDAYLAMTQDNHGVTIVLSQEQREFVGFAVENSYWTKLMIPTEVSIIIYEETEAVWAGDKTPSDAAEIIQNRVDLYLKE